MHSYFIVDGSQQPELVKDISPLLPTSSQQCDTAQSPSTSTVIREILPSPPKTTPVAIKKRRKITKPILHLTSPQSKINLLEKDAMKTLKTDKRAVENKKNTTDDEKNMNKKNKRTPGIKIKGSSAKQREIGFVFTAQKNPFIHRQRIGFSSHAKNGATKNVVIWEGEKARAYVFYVLLINIDLITHYLSFVNDSKAYNVKNI